MATTRIKDITTAATTFSSDDFVAIDGATSGTRKMAKDDLITEVSSGVSGTYLEESNNLSDVASLDTSKLNMEIPDVGTAPNEVPLNQFLGSCAYQDADALTISSASTDDLEISGNLTFTSTGKINSAVGIDVTPTASKLEVSGNTNSSLMMTRTSSGIVSNLEDAAGYGSLLLYQAGGSAKVSIQGNGNSYFNGGNVGIGATSGAIAAADDDAALVLQQSVGGVAELSRATDTDGHVVGKVNFANRNNSNTVNPGSANYPAVAGIEAQLETTDSNAHDDSGGHLVFKTKPEAGLIAERVRINSSGNVSVGDGTLVNNGSLHVYRSSATADINLQSAGGSGRSYALQSKSDGNLVIRDNNAAADRWSINPSGDFVSEGGGIDLGATVLTEFEQGVFTASLAPATSGTLTIDTASDQLAYAIVGDIVTVHGQIALDGASSPVGNYVKINLPAAIALGTLSEDADYSAGSCVVTSAAGNLGDYSLLAVGGDSYLRIYKNTASTFGATAADFNGDESIYISITYRKA